MKYGLPAPDDIYPVPPVEIARRLGFCLGNAVLCVLCAPYRDGVEDCDRALEYLAWEAKTSQPVLDHFAYHTVIAACDRLLAFLRDTPGDALWRDITHCQLCFLEEFRSYLFGKGGSIWSENSLLPQNSRGIMSFHIRDLQRVLSLRDTTGQIYEGMTGLPEKEDE